ncbi:hypothetical protein SAMN04488102_12511 [Alkalibacterium subtropicum]|uniref:Uncharacterized protein n=1 Tax=Alkalibacterium subtropicum TaxID=753702 RepID=A0A1I1LM48_9LACT|nr:hypothetical protein [Alkalibacterium subtropicum]SFC74297.1 hypothetical protein SAMN04488102_12511 [Alkalibacterium subtropicum]
MSVKFDVFRDRIINADTEEVKDLIKQFRQSRQNGDISEEEEENLKDIAHRKLESGNEDPSS